MNRTTRVRARWIVAVAMATLASAPVAEAQRRAGSGGAAPPGREAGRGLMLGLHLLAAPGVSIQGEDVDVRTTFGPGAGLMVGYGFNRTWSGFISLDVARQGSGMDDVEGSFGLAHVEIGARANLPGGNALTRPYLVASLGRRSLAASVTDFGDDEPYDVTITGSMLALGAGIERVISPTMALDGGLELGFGTFGSYDVAGERYTESVNRSSTMRLRFGVVWRP